MGDGHHIANILTIVATVATLMATGFFVACFIRMRPIEVSIVNACRSGQHARATWRSWRRRTACN